MAPIEDWPGGMFGSVSWFYVSLLRHTTRGYFSSLSDLEMLVLYVAALAHSIRTELFLLPLSGMGCSLDHGGGGELNFYCFGVTKFSFKNS